MDRTRNNNRPTFTSPGFTNETVRPQTPTPGRESTISVSDALDRLRHLNPNPEGQGGAGGQNNPGLEADGQGERDQAHDDHHHHHGNEWGLDFRVGPTIVVPRRVVVSPSTTYVTPASPLENLIPTPSVDAPDVVLLNPTRNGGPVNYTLNDVRCTMAPGFQQKLPGERAWIIEFDRGGSFGTARYSLTPGKYAFVVTERGWDIIRRTPAIATDVPAPAPAAPDVAQASP
jgi:hypothetical protein